MQLRSLKKDKQWMLATEVNHFWRPFAGKDEQPCALAAEEARVRLSRSFELSRSTSGHDFESE